MLKLRLARSLFKVMSAVVQVQFSKFARKLSETATMLSRTLTEEGLAVAAELYCGNRDSIVHDSRGSYVLDGEKNL